MNLSEKIYVREIIDDEKVGFKQYLIVVIIFLLALIDGLDTLIISYVAPQFSAEFHISKATMGFVFSVGLTGGIIGAFTLGTLGDVIGNKRVLVGATLLIGVTTLLIGFSSSLNVVLILRFLQGVGMGGSLPNLIATVSKFVPTNRRTIFITLIGCGFPLGVSLGGLVVAMVLPNYGWHAAFLVSGIFSLVLLPLLIFFLPEVIPQQLKESNGQTAVRQLLKKFYPLREVSEGELDWRSDTVVMPKMPIAVLFQEKRTLTTILIWIVFLMGFLDIYILTNWLPTLIQEADFSMQESIYATTGFSLAGVIASPILGWLIDKYNLTVVLVTSYLFAALFILLLAMFGNIFAIILFATFGCGFFLSGSQGSLYGIPSFFYPTQARSTATGWAMGVGRFGSILGPVLVGFLLSASWTAKEVLLVATVPAVLASLTILLMYLFGISSNKSALTAR